MWLRWGEVVGGDAERADTQRLGNGQWPACRSTNGFRLTFSAQSNILYAIQRATNIAPPVVWQWINSGVTNRDGLLQVLDSGTASGMQFYRVQAQ